MVVVVTDAVADLPVDISKKVLIVPLKVRIGEQYVYSSELSPEQVHKMLMDYPPGVLGTSQPSPQDFIRVFSPVDDDIVYVAASSRLSGTINAARIAVKMLKRQNIYIFDSLMGSLAQGLLVARALELAERELTAGDILTHLEQARRLIRAYFTVGNLKYLRATGRVGQWAEIMGRMLHVVPILTLRDGEVTKAGICPSTHVIKKLANMLGKGNAWVGYVGESAVKNAEELANLINADSVVPLGPVISVHLGPGTFGGATIAQR